MAILNYSTKISAGKTIGEIQEILAKHGATKIVVDYADGNPTAVTFSLLIDGSYSFFSLPAQYNGVLKAMKKDKAVKASYCTEAQAIKVSWRIIKDWISAQCAIIEAGLAEMAEVFLPYALTRSGNTLYAEIKGNPAQFLKIRS